MNNVIIKLINYLLRSYNKDIMKRTKEKPLKFSIKSPPPLSFISDLVPYYVHSNTTHDFVVYLVLSEVRAMQLKQDVLCSYYI